MKKLIVLSALAIAISSLSNIATAQAPQDTNTVNTTSARSGLVEIIDGIAVPHEILMQVQLDHQGKSIISVRETGAGSMKAYLAVVDDDDVRDANVIHIYFDQEWNKLEELNITAPPAPEPATTEEAQPTEQTEPQPAPESAQTPSPSQTKPEQKPIKPSSDNNTQTKPEEDSTTQSGTDTNSDSTSTETTTTTN